MVGKYSAEVLYLERERERQFSATMETPTSFCNFDKFGEGKPWVPIEKVGELDMCPSLIA